MESISNKTEWGISIEAERDIWNKNLINILIPLPSKCRYCNKGVLYLRNNNNIINPLLGKCNNYKCNREVYLRVGTIFQNFKKTPASVLFNILFFWLIEECNAAKISVKLRNIYNINSVNINLIYRFLQNCREIIANYIRSIYILDPLAKENANQHIAIDESLFTHNGDIAQWVVGLINTHTNEIRLEIVQNRDTNTLKPILEKHVLKGNIIISDSWAGYFFLNRIDSGYVHHTFNHARGNFGYGIDSTSRIEGIWGELKLTLKKIYATIRPKNFVYFLRESEYRRLTKTLDIDKKIEYFATAVSVVGIDLKNDLLSEEDLLSFQYDTMYDD